jgi:hypothetical protein
MSALSGMQFVVIDGWWASGKGGVLYLLDGHPEVLVNPFQEGIFGAIATLRGDEHWIRMKQFEGLRRRLCSPGSYYRLEDYFRKGSFPLYFSKDCVKYFPMSLDFAAFDRLWTDRLAAVPEWTPALILQTYCEAYAETQGSRPRFYVCLENNSPGTVGGILRHLPSAKVVYTIRDPFAIVNALAGRVGNKVNFLDSATPKSEFFFNGQYQQMVEARKLAIRQSREHPDRMLLVEFDELYGNTSRFRDRLLRLLGVSPHPAFEQATLRGEAIDAIVGRPYFSGSLDPAGGQKRQEKFFAALGTSTWGRRLLERLVRHGLA